ncbi:MAG: zeta toxin family protein, partial [Synergistaceae bacterium]|nr:zeta toxin family protein [Synergistaceae bacterium]
KEEGYRVDVTVMAAGGEFSKLGILERYEGQKADVGYGWWTSPATHGKTYDGIPETAKLVELKCRIDSFSVYNRSGGILYANTSRDGVYTKPPHNADARAAIMKERNRPLTPEEQSTLLEGRRRMLENMKRRGAAPEEITRALAILGKTPRLRQEFL